MELNVIRYKQEDVEVLTTGINDVLVTKILNPFDPYNSKEITIVQSGAPLHTYLDAADAPTGYDYIISLNGLITEDYAQILKPGDSLAFVVVPQGGSDDNSKVFRTALILALTLATYGAFTTVSLGGYAAGLAGLSQTGTVAGLINAGVVMGGTYMISHMLPPNVDRGKKESLDSSPTYNWQTAGNQLGSGQKIGVLYGTTKIVPQVLSYYVKTNGPEQTLNVLYALGEGIISDIQLDTIVINDNPISYYGDTHVVSRSGENVQTALPNFSDLRIDINVNAELTFTDDGSGGNEDWTTIQTSGNLTDSLEVTLSAPRGLFKMVDGDFEYVEVDVTVEYRRIEDELGDPVSESWAPMIEQYSFSGFPPGNAIGNATVRVGDWVKIADGTAYTAEIGSSIVIPDNTIGRIVAVLETRRGLTTPTNFYVLINDFTLFSTNEIWEYPLDIDGDFVDNFIILDDRRIVPGVYPAAPHAHQNIGVRDYLVVPDESEIPGYDPLVTNRLYMHGNTSTVINQFFYMAGLPYGKYEIRAQRLYEEEKNSEGDPLANKSELVKFNYATQVTSREFTYPNIALVGMSSLATEKINGSMPKVAIIADRGDITLPVVGAQPSNNPAWACYDMLTNTRYGAGIDPSNIDTAKFMDWADWCDVEGFKVNIYIDTSFTLTNALKMISILGRGQIVQIGKTYSVILEKSEVTTQAFMFTMGNITRDSFSQQFVPIADRANILLLSFFNKDADYEEQTLQLAQADYDVDRMGERKKEMTLYGCTDIEQAKRYGRYLLNTNRYITQTVSWQSDVQAIACMVGDIVRVSHDVPQWGESGNIIGVYDYNLEDSIFVVGVYENGVYEEAIADIELVLDQAITFHVGITYVITIKHSDDTIATSTFTVSEEITTNAIPQSSIINPEIDNVYTIGENTTESKLFRITGITRASDHKRSITAIEYLPEMYIDDIDIVDPYAATTTTDIEDLRAEIVRIENSDGTRTSAINISWVGSALFWDVYYRKVNTSGYTLAGRTSLKHFQISNVPQGTYEIRVGDATIIVTVPAEQLYANIYTWTKYADDINGAGISDDPVDKEYIGHAYNKTTAIESTDPADYIWSKIEAGDGVSTWLDITSGVLSYVRDANGIWNTTDNTQLTAYFRVDDIDYSRTIEVSLNQTNATITVLSLGTSTEIAVTANGDNTNYVVFEFEHIGTGITANYAINAVVSGLSSKAAALNATYQVFSYDTAGANPSPSGCDIIASAVNFIDPYFEFFIDNVSVQGPSKSNEYAYTPPALFNNMPEQISVGVRDGGVTNPVEASDIFTVFGVKAGLNSITPILSNEAHSLPRTNTGTITYTGSGTDIVVFEGTDQVPYDNSAPYAVPSFRTSAVGNNITVGALSHPDAYTVRYGNHSNMTETSATVTYTITIVASDGIENVFTKIQSLSQSSQGENGADGVNGESFNLNYMLPEYVTFGAVLPDITYDPGLGAVDISGAYAYHGLYSLKMASTADNQYIWFTPSWGDWPTPIVPNKKWVLSAYVLSPQAHAATHLSVSSSEGISYYSGTKYTSTTPLEWTRISYVVDMSADVSTSLRVKCNNNTSGNTVYWDAFMLEPYPGSDIPSRFSDVTISDLTGADGVDGLTGVYTEFAYSAYSSTPTGGSYDGTTFTYPAGWYDDPSSVSGWPIYMSISKWEEISAGVWSIIGAWSVPKQWNGADGTSSWISTTGPINYMQHTDGTWVSTANTVIYGNFNYNRVVVQESVIATLDTNTGVITISIGADHLDIDFSVTDNGTRSPKVTFTHTPTGNKVSQALTSVSSGARGSMSISAVISTNITRSDYIYYSTTVNPCYNAGYRFLEATGMSCGDLVNLDNILLTNTYAGKEWTLHFYYNEATNLWVYADFLITGDMVVDGSILAGAISTSEAFIGHSIKSGGATPYSWDGSGTPIGFGLFSDNAVTEAHGYNIVGGAMYGGTIVGSTLSGGEVLGSSLYVLSSNGLKKDRTIIKGWAGSEFSVDTTLPTTTEIPGGATAGTYSYYNTKTGIYGPLSSSTSSLSNSFILNLDTGSRLAAPEVDEIYTYIDNSGYLCIAKFELNNITDYVTDWYVDYRLNTVGGDSILAVTDEVTGGVVTSIHRVYDYAGNNITGNITRFGFWPAGAAYTGWYLVQTNLAIYVYVPKSIELSFTPTTSGEFVIQVGIKTNLNSGITLRRKAPLSVTVFNQ